MTAKPAERRFDVGWGSLAAWEWPGTGGPRLLCLHGWLDNAASYAPLAAALGDCHLLALELAGHGHSDHRPGGTRYHFTDHLFDIDAVAAAIGWDDFVLVGHSMGAGLASCYAAAVPERVSALVLLDGLGPLAIDHDDSTRQLRRSIESVRHPKSLQREYADLDTAAASRTRRFPLSLAAARLLAERGLRGGPGHWRWRVDPRLLWISPVRMTESQAREILAAIECPVLVAMAGFGAAHMGERLQERLAVMRRARLELCDGTHHFHMDEAGATARLIDDFLSNPPEAYDGET